MAEVTGDLGGQPIELNNAATEATLKELVRAVALLAAKQGKDGKSEKQIAESMKKFYKQLEESSDGFKKLTKLQKEKIKQDEEENKAQKEKIKQYQEELRAQEKFIEGTKLVASGFTKVASSASALGSSFFGLMNDLANMGNNINAVGGIIGKIPIFGGVLGSAFGAVAGAATKTYESFNKAASVGANFGGSIQEMQRQVSATGLTLDQYTSIIKNNSENLALFGGSVTQGAKRLSEMSQKIRNSQLGDELARLGYSTEDINNGIARYSAIVTKSAGGVRVSNEELVKDTGDYLRNLDAVSKLTGKNKEILQREQEARQADAQFRILQAKVGKEGAKNLNMLMDSMSESEKQAAQTILATGSLNSEAAQQLMITNPQAAKALLQASRDIRQSGTMTREGAFKIDEAFNAGAIASQKNAAQVTLATYDAEKWGKGIVSNLDRANRAEKDNGSLRAQAAQQELDRQKQLTEGAKGLDPAKMKSNMEKLADLSNKFMAALANSPLLDKMLQSFTAAIEELTPILIEGLTWVADHAKEVAIGMGILGGLIVVSSAITAAANLVQAVNVLGLTALASAVWATVAPVLAAAAPFIAVAAAVAGVVYLFKKLYDSCWTFGTIIDVLKDNFQRLWMTLQDWMDSLLEKIPNAIGGISKAEADRRRALRDDQRKELDAKEKDRDDKRKQKAIERGTYEEDKKATQEHTKTTQAATAAAQEATKTTEAQVEAQKKINYTSPEETFKAFKERKTMGGGAPSPATPATAPAAPTGGPAPGAAGPLNQDQQKNMALVEAALKKQGITDPAYVAAVKGNIMKETGGKSISENMNYANTSNDRIRKIFGSRAAGKSDAELNAIKGDQQKMGEMMYGSGTAMGRQMGNTEPGDGWKYRGRGFIQLTGKNNYAAASKAIYGDDRLVKNPDLVNDPQVAAEVSAWYMKKGQAGMASKLGMGTSGLSQEQANLLATSQIAGGDIRRKGAIGEEILGKVNSYSGQFAKGGSVTPSTSTAQTSVSQQPAAPAPAAATAQPRTGATTPTPAKATQETAESQLSLLNTKMDLLVMINRKLLEVNDKQLTTQKSMTGNVYSA